MSNLTALLKEAQQKLQAGQRTAALTLLKQAHQQAPQDYRVWLLLAQAAPSPAKRADCIRRAEQLAPESTAVQKAVAWLEQQEKTPSPQPPKPAQEDTLEALRRRTQATPAPVAAAAKAPTAPPQKRRAGLWLATTAVLLLILFGGGWLLFSSGTLNYLWATGAQDAVQTASSAPLSVSPSATPSPTHTPSPTVTPSPSATPLFDLPEALTQPLVTATAVQVAMVSLNADAGVRPKPVSARLNSDDPRPTWTPTPVPTNTPTPTPSPQPTFVAESGPLIPPFIGPSEKWIDVNLTTQTLRAYEGSTLVLESVISSGRAPYYTVTGQFRIYLRYESQTMDGRSLGFDYVTPNVPHVQYFYGNFALHGAFWHNDFGVPVSHGCVNLNLTDAAWLYNWAGYGTLVNVHY